MIPTRITFWSTRITVWSAKDWSSKGISAPVHAANSQDEEASPTSFFWTKGIATQVPCLHAKYTSFWKLCKMPHVISSEVSRKLWCTSQSTSWNDTICICWEVPWMILCYLGLLLKMRFLKPKPQHVFLEATCAAQASSWKSYAATWLPWTMLWIISSNQIWTTDWGHLWKILLLSLLLLPVLAHWDPKWN